MFGFYLQALWASATAALLLNRFGVKTVAPKPLNAGLQEALHSFSAPPHPTYLPQSLSYKGQEHRGRKSSAPGARSRGVLSPDSGPGFPTIPAANT